jgi:hypothetical protein
MIFFALPMKKPLLIFILAAYAASVFGIGVKEFYCCGKFVNSSLQLVSSDNHRCGMDQEEKAGCCKTRVQFHKVTDNHGAASSVSLNEKTDLFAVIPSLPETETSPAVASAETIGYRPNAPPPRRQVPIYIFDCIYRL